MSTIINFNDLEIHELQSFAEDFVDKINTGNILTSDANFEVENVEADELSGDLAISIFNKNYYIPVARKATWQSANEEEARNPIDPDFHYSIYEDVEKAFNVREFEIDGYKVTVEIDDVNDEEVIDVDPESISSEDSGIGDYEFFGMRGHDSNPYYEVEGTITLGCTCFLTLWVEPII